MNEGSNISRRKSTIGELTVSLDLELLQIRSSFPSYVIVLKELDQEYNFSNIDLDLELLTL